MLRIWPSFTSSWSRYSGEASPSIVRVASSSLVLAAVPEQVEHGEAVRVTGDGLAVDDARVRRQRGDRGGGQREALGEVETLSGDELYAARVKFG